MNPREALRYMVTAAALGSVVCALSGCGRDLDTLYGDADAGAPDAQKELPPFPDVGAYLQQPECVECIERPTVERGCANAWVRCMEDAECVRSYECNTLCADPACHRACDEDLTPPLEQVQQWIRMTGSASAYETLSACVSGKCADVCALGRDFSCTGRWDYTSDHEPGTKVQLAFGVVEFPSFEIPEARVSICPEGDFLCLAPVATVTTSGGTTAVEVKANSREGFRGFRRFEPLDQEGKPLLDQLQVMYSWPSWPLSTGTWWGQYLGRRGLSAAYWTSAGFDYEPERPILYLSVTDCHLSRAPGLRVETDADCAPFERCDYYWEGSTITADLRQTQRAPTASANVAPPADLLVDIRVVDVETGRPVSRFVGSPPANTQHSVFLEPFTTTQLEHLEASGVTGEE